MASDEQIELILKEYQDGKSITRIVRELGVPKHWVYFALGSKGIKPRAAGGQRGTNVTLLRPMKNTSSRMATVPASIIKELGIDQNEAWEIKWTILDRKRRLIQAEARPCRG
ncbi:MAG: hypothetical protein QW057_00195 [Candidatus Bathyarchaeia archaeon]